jgi:hypothetical protein
VYIGANPPPDPAEGDLWVEPGAWEGIPGPQGPPGTPGANGSPGAAGPVTPSLVARGWTQGTAAWPATPIGTGETAVLQLNRQWAPSRVFMVRVTPATIIPSAATQLIMRLRHTNNNTVPSTASTQLLQAVMRCDTAGGNYRTPLMEYIVTTSTGTQPTWRLLVTAYVQAGTFQFQTSLEIHILDLGPDTGQSGNAGTALGSGGTGV